MMTASIIDVPLDQLPAIQLHPNAKDLSGKVFGRLTAIRPVRRETDSSMRWLCLCSCKTYSVVSKQALVNGSTRSCGCWNKQSHTKHGLYGTKAYNAWCSMKKRCQSPGTHNYHLYGARGITICPEWQNFDTFFADLGHPPTDKHQLDRIDNDSGYYSDNCRWATSQENNQNRGITTLDAEKVKAIRLYSVAGIPQRTIAKYVGCTQPTVSLVVNGKAWSNI